MEWLIAVLLGFVIKLSAICPKRLNPVVASRFIEAAVREDRACSVNAVLLGELGYAAYIGLSPEMVLE